MYMYKHSGSCRCALIGVPCRLRTPSVFSTFDNMLKPTVSPQAKRAETDCRQGTPTRAHFQPPDVRRRWDSSAYYYHYYYYYYYCCDN